MVSRWSSVSPSVVRPAVRFSFPDDNLSKHRWIFTNLVCALILWRSGLGLLIGQISSVFDGVICLRHSHIFVSG